MEDRIPFRFEDDPHLPGAGSLPPLDDRPDPLAPPPGYGEPRYATPQAANDSGSPDTLCAAGRESPSSPPVCTREHEFVFVFGDVAEHIQRVELCREHSAQMADDLARGSLVTCTVCGSFCRLEGITDRETGEDSGYAELLEAGKAATVQRALDGIEAMFTERVSQGKPIYYPSDRAALRELAEPPQALYWSANEYGPTP